MNAKEKAKELVCKYIPICYQSDIITTTAKQCALIAVDEIINIIDAEDQFILYNYWQQVKQEILNL